MLEKDPVFLQALEEVCDEEFENYLRTLEDCDPHVFSEKHNKKMQKLIKRQRSPFFRFTNTTCKRVACVIVAVFIVSASALSVKAIREPVFNFVSNIFSDHTVVTTESESDEGYPDTIKDEYCISDLPNGFELKDEIKSIDSIDKSYFYNEQYILLSQNTKKTYKQNYDNEHSSFNELTDSNGEKYIIIQNEYDITIIWDNGRYIFVIKSNLHKEKVLELCKSIKIK